MNSKTRNYMFTEGRKEEERKERKKEGSKDRGKEGRRWKNGGRITEKGRNGRRKQNIRKDWLMERNTEE